MERFGLVNLTVDGKSPPSSKFITSKNQACNGDTVAVAPSSYNENSIALPQTPLAPPPSSSDRSRKERQSYYMPIIKRVPAGNKLVSCGSGLSKVPAASARRDTVNFAVHKTETNKFMDKKLKIAGNAASFPKAHISVEVNTDTGNLAQHMECSACLCEFRNQNVAKSDHPLYLGRHQSCICECYCHFKPQKVSMIFVAAKTGNVHIMRQALNAGGDAKEIDIFGNSPLHLTAIHGYTAVAKELIAAGSRINAINEDGNTALHLAARYGHYDMITLLCKSLANPNVTNKVGHSPIHYGVLYSQLGVVQELLNAHQLNGSITDLYGNTPLHTIVGKPSMHILKALLFHKKMNVNAQNQDGCTPLHLAVTLAKPEVISALLSNADVLLNIGNEAGNTPLHLAVKHKNSDAVRALLRARKKRPEIKDDNDAQNLTIMNFTRDIDRKNGEGQTPLHLAVSTGSSVNIVGLLLDFGCDPTTFDASGNNVLHNAVTHGNFLITKKLVECGVDTNSCNARGVSALHLAAHFNDAVLTKLLLISGVNPDLLDANHRTALHRAIECDHRLVAELLVRRGADVNVMDKGGQSPLALGLSNGRLVLVELLMKRCANRVNALQKDWQGDTLIHLAVRLIAENLVSDLVKISSVSILVQNALGNTPLHDACKQVFHPATKLFLSTAEEYGFMLQLLNATNVAGKTALHVAAMAGDYDSAQLLVAKGASVNDVDSSGRSPLHLTAHCASRTDSLDVADLLLDTGATAAVADNSGSTPLHEAAKVGNEELISLLLDEGIEIDQQDGLRRTPLFIATSMGHEPSIDILLQEGANVTLLLEDGSNAIHAAAAAGSVHGVRSLIGKGIDPQLCDHKGLTPGHKAAEHDQAVVLEYLASIDVNLDMQDNLGRTPLHIASENRSANALLSLLRSGVQVNMQDGEGRTSLHYACRSKGSDIVKMLKEHGGDIDIIDSSGKSPKDLLEDCGEVVLVIPAPGVENLLTDQLEHQDDGPTLTPYLSFCHQLLPNIYKYPPSKQLNKYRSAVTKHADSWHQNPLLGHPCHIGYGIQLKLARGGTRGSKIGGIIEKQDVVEKVGIKESPRKDRPLPSWKTEAVLVGDSLQPPEIGDIYPSSPRHTYDKEAAGGGIGDGDAKAAGKQQVDDNYLHILSDDEDPDLFSRPSSGALSPYLTAPKAVRPTTATSASPRATKLPVLNLLPADDDEAGITPLLSPPDSPTEEIDFLSVSFGLGSEGGHSRSGSRLKLPPLVGVPGSPSFCNPYPSPFSRSPGYYTPESLPQIHVEKVDTPQSAEIGTTFPIETGMQPARQQELKPKQQYKKRSWIFDSDIESVSESVTVKPEKASDSDSAVSAQTRATAEWSDASYSLSESSDSEDEEDGNNSEQLGSEMQKQWGKAEVDPSFREELERQRVADERKEKAMKIRLAKAKIKKNSLVFNADLSIRSGADLSDYEWLAQYCILPNGARHKYLKIFKALRGSSGEERSHRDRLSLSETLMALSYCSRDLNKLQRHYVIQIGDLLGYNMAEGCDFRHFSVLAALSQRISSLDTMMKTLYQTMDIKALDMKTFLCRSLWEMCSNPKTTHMSKDRLIIMLKAGGIPASRIQQVERTLTSNHGELDFLDFLTYIPLFLAIHNSVIANPFSSSI